MKVGSTPIEATNPFADAAGVSSDSMPGGPDGLVGQVATEWNKAVQAISGQANQGSDSQVQDGKGSQPDPSMIPVPALADMTGQPAPMGAQWDRLSMTVASLVAWNLNNDVAPDAVEDLVTVSPQEQLAMPVVGTDDSALVIQEVDVAIAATTTQTIVEVENPTYVQDNLQEPKSKLETITARIAGQTGTLNQDNTPFREGKMIAPDGVRQVQTSTESEPSTVKADGEARVGTLVDTTSHSSSYEPKVRLDPEIPPSMTAAAESVSVKPTSTAVKPHVQAPATVAPAQAQAQGSVHAEQMLAQAKAPSVATASEMVKSGSVQAPLAHAAEMVDRSLRAGLSPIAQSHETAVPTSSTAPTAPTVPTAEKIASEGVRQEMDLKALRRGSPGADARRNLTLSAPQVSQQSAPVSQPSAPAPMQSSSPTSPMGEFGVPSDIGLRSQRPDSLLAATLRPEVSSTVEPVLPTGEGMPAAGVMHQPVSDMERDFSATNSMLDAEHIGAEEVPELPLAEATHFDIDIDDPGGQVRLDLTRQAEEVAVRLETPEEILEEYRDLEKDIEEALEDAGMSLADFEATADGDPQERSDRESRERTSSGSQDRDSGTEETPKRGRLLNRIV